MLIRSRLVKFAGLLGLSWLLCACGFPAPTATSVHVTPDELATSLAATQTVSSLINSPTVPTIGLPSVSPSPSSTSTVEPTATPSPSPTPLENNLFGEICFPGGAIPAMTAFFENTETEALVELPITQGQDRYELKLAPGTYIAYAWLLDFSQGGLYSRAVPCGLGEECDDHSLLPFDVDDNEITQGIDLCDWYAGPFNVPYPPGKEQTEITGVISGSLSYPDGIASELRVVAFNVRTGYWYWAYAQPGQAFYSITELPPGIYNVVAYDTDGHAGGYASNNHDLIDVTVEPGKVSEGININDWNAPAGTFPPDPTR